jgi:TetR/AcrR family acrAB operon transcriptional repressor
MPRRTKEKAAETKEKILISALDTFYKKGFHRSKLEDIAARIDLTKGAVYWHFKNKKDLLFSLAREMEKREEQMFADLGLKATSINDLKNLMYEYARMVESDSILHKYYYTFSYRIEWTEELADIWDYYKKQQEEFIEFIADILKQLLERKEISNDFDIQSVAISLFLLIDGLIVNVLTYPNQLGLSHYVKTALDIFFRGLQSESEKC